MVTGDFDLNYDGVIDAVEALRDIGIQNRAPAAFRLDESECFFGGCRNLFCYCY